MIFPKDKEKICSNIEIVINLCYNLYSYMFPLRKNNRRKLTLGSKNKERSFSKMKKITNSEQTTSILYIIIGVLLIIFRSETLGWAMTIAGAFFVISGVLDVLKKNYTGGGISLFIGIAILILGWIVAGIVLLVLGILIAIKGAVALLEVLKSKKPEIMDILFPACTVLAGIMLAFGNGFDILIVITGVLLAIDGAVGLLGSMKK